MAHNNYYENQRVVIIDGASPQYLVPEPENNMGGLQTVKPIDMETQNEHYYDEIMVSSHKKDSYASGKYKQENNCHVKLPELEMPVFDGDKIKWKQFWDFFKVTVDQNERLSDIEKLCYLKSMLKGGAQEVISGLILSHENYQVAKLLLVYRFEDDQVVLHFHFTQLISLAPARNTSKGLRLVYDKIESHLQSLEALQQDINHDIFVSIISSKIPKDVFLQLELQKGVNNKWSVSLLRELFNNYICAAERADDLANCSKAKNTIESQVIRDRPWERHSINPKLFIQGKYCDGNH